MVIQTVFWGYLLNKYSAQTRSITTYFNGRLDSNGYQLISGTE